MAAPTAWNDGDAVSLAKSLHDVRSYNNKRQLDVTGGKDTRYYAQYETAVDNRHGVPSLRIMVTWSLNAGYTHEEMVYLLGRAKHLPDAIPTGDEIIAHLDPKVRELARIPYPCAILDKRMSLWAINPVYFIWASRYMNLFCILKQRTNLLQIAYDRDKRLNRHIDNPITFRAHTIRLLKALAIYHQHQHWYEQIPTNMAASLRHPEDYRAFQQDWLKWDDMALRRKSSALYKHSSINGPYLLTVRNDHSNGLGCRFRLHTELIHGLGNHFFVLHHVPDTKSGLVNNSWFSIQENMVKSAGLTMWDSRITNPAAFRHFVSSYYSNAANSA